MRFAWAPFSRLTARPTPPGTTTAAPYRTVRQLRWTSTCDRRRTASRCHDRAVPFGVIGHDGARRRVEARQASSEATLDRICGVRTSRRDRVKDATTTTDMPATRSGVELRVHQLLEYRLVPRVPEVRVERAARVISR